jgi:hypothetical protein
MKQEMPSIMVRLLGVLLAVIVLTSDASADDSVYLQVSSHPSRDAAVSAAQWYSREHPDVSVYASSSGFFAVTIAHLPRPTAEGLLAQLLASASVPSDAYLTEGARFGPLVWSSAGNAVAVPEPSRNTTVVDQDIVLSGPVDAYAALLIARQITERPNARRVLLNSDGGNALAGLTIARMIHNAGLDTYIPPRAACYSACAFVFAAGRSKRADGLLGVHQMSADLESNEFTQAFLAEVLQEMAVYGVPPEAIDRMLRTPANEIHVFTPEELRRFGW